MDRRPLIRMDPAVNIADIAVILVAAGRGTRLGGEAPKQYRRIGGKTVLAHALGRLGAVTEIGRVMVVIHPDDAAPFAAAAIESGISRERVGVTFGGASRQESVRAGLEALAIGGFPQDGVTLIHDAARPFAGEAVILRAILAASRHGAALPVMPIADTLATLDQNGYLAGNTDRAATRIVQTPQAFRFGLIRDAHARAWAEGRTDFTDDAGLVAAYGHAVASFPGEADLFKITTEADITHAEAWLTATHETRTGIGYDVHAFADGDYLWLGGVKIAHEKTLAGHSDADPVLHALTDALLGTIGDGDIGMHFPPSDPRWKGAASRIFLEGARRRVEAKGGHIVSADCTIVCEAPKIGPHRAAMQAVIAEILGLAPDRIGVKATTSERLGFTGRREGIAAICIASVAF